MASRRDDLPVGSFVVGLTGWQDYCVADALRVKICHSQSYPIRYRPPFPRSSESWATPEYRRTSVSSSVILDPERRSLYPLQREQWDLLPVSSQSDGGPEWSVSQAAPRNVDTW